MPVRLTEKSIQAFEWTGKATNFRDERLPGFFLAVNKTCKSYKIQAELWQGPHGRKELIRTIRHTIGTTDTHSLVEARAIASDLLNQIKRGRDPFPAKATDGSPAPIMNGDPSGWTVDELMREYTRVLEEKECADRSIANIEEVRGALSSSLGQQIGNRHPKKRCSCVARINHAQTRKGRG